MAIPDWFINELIYAGGEHLDAEYVRGYDVKAGNDPTDDIALLREYGLNETHTLVDMGSGTGTFALAAAPYCRRVVAVDVSDAMVTAMRDKLDAGQIGNVEPVQAGFLSYAHTGEPVDFVYSRHALHHLSDFWKAMAIARMAAMLKPGGVLVLRDLLYSFEPSEAEAAIDAWLAGASRTPGVGWSRAELVTHIQDEYSTFTWLVEAMLTRSGFEIVRADHAPSRIYSVYVCVKG